MCVELEEPFLSSITVDKKVSVKTHFNHISIHLVVLVINLCKIMSIIQFKKLLQRLLLTCLYFESKQRQE